MRLQGERACCVLAWCLLAVALPCASANFCTAIPKSWIFGSFSYSLPFTRVSSSAAIRQVPPAPAPRCCQHSPEAARHRAQVTQPPAPVRTSIGCSGQQVATGHIISALSANIFSKRHRPLTFHFRHPHPLQAATHSERQWPHWRRQESVLLSGGSGTLLGSVRIFRSPETSL